MTGRLGAASAVAGLLLAPLLVVLFAVGLGGGSAAQAVGGSRLSGHPDLGRVSRRFVPWLVRAARVCPGVSAPMVAAQVDVESGWNPHAVSPKGAEGLAQFLPSTWASWGVDADGDGVRSPFDPPDAIVSLGRYMCFLIDRVESAESSGVVSGDPLSLALAAYNAGLGAVLRFHGVPPYAETRAYVARVLARAAHYTARAPGSGGGGDDAVAARLLAVLRSRLGTPYVYGGGDQHGPTTGIRGGPLVGFDCSSYVLYGVFQATGGAVLLPRTAAGQAVALSRYRVPVTRLVPGDLVFYDGTTWSSIGHVVVYLGGGRVIEEPHTGQTARIEQFTLTGLVGAVHPPWARLAADGYRP